MRHLSTTLQNSDPLASKSQPHEEDHQNTTIRFWLKKNILSQSCVKFYQKKWQTVCEKGSRLAHLYVLPKTHKTTLAMRPILSATGTYNYALAMWLDEKLKPLSTNEYTISDVFNFAEEIRRKWFSCLL